MGNYIIKNEDGIEYICSQKLEDIKTVRHFFSTRIGKDNNFNLNVFNINEKEKININYKKIFNASKMKGKCVYLKQVHGNKFYEVNDDNFEHIIGKEGDALITKAKGIAIGVLTADCVPVLICDYKNNVIAAVHAGWRGTFEGITYNVLDYMINKMGCSKDNIVMSIGPSIGPCCFEVGMEVALKFSCVKRDKEKFYVDLWKENINQAKSLGIKENNIDLFGLCTACNNQLFYSYRKENGTEGRLGAFIQILKEE